MAKGEYCPQPYGYLRRLKDGIIKPCPCNKLSCKVCGKRKRNKLLDDISYGFDLIKSRGGQLKFMTFTTSYQSEQAKFGKYLHRFMMALRYYGIINPEYIWLPEKTKSDLIHCHMLINVGWLDKEEIKDLWWKCTDETAWNCSIDAIQLRSPAGYMAKYLSKNLADNSFRKGTRRYNFSRNWPRLEAFKSVDKWEFLTPGNYAHMYDPDRVKNIALLLSGKAFNPNGAKFIPQDSIKEALGEKGELKKFEPYKKPAVRKRKTHNQLRTERGLKGVRRG